MSSNVIVIAGPTASGKSWLAAALAQAIGGVVINADSQQLYNALPILTAQPTADLNTLAPHRLYSVIEPTATCTAVAWAEMAYAEIAAANGPAILVGGTGLYLEALMHGIAPIPQIPDAARIQAQEDFETIGRAAFYARLIAADPASAVLKPGDTQRILRAWEVLSATGRTLKSWQQEAHTQSDLTFQSILILPPRETLRAACDQRFITMIEQGALAEVENFLADYERTAPATRALGFMALADYLQHKLTLPQAIEIAQAQTRQYAKRQSTWFRNRFQKTTNSFDIFDAATPENLQKILRRLRGLNHN